MPTLVARIVARDDWPTTKIMLMLREAGADVVSDSIARALPGAPAPVQRKLLALLQAGDPQVALPAIRELLLETDSDDVVIRAIHVVAELADPRGLKIARAHASHADWRVRVHAVRALGRMGDERDVPVLVRALADRHYWVRYRAARALASLPMLTTTRLEEIRDAARDRFARDIVTQVIAEESAA
jgi:HEAT repeat protein